MRKGRNRNNSGTEINYWPGFVDLMSMAAIVFLLLLIIVFAENKQAQAEIERTGVKLKILEEIRQSIENETGPGNVKVDNGTLVLNERVLFATNRWDITPEGRQLISSITTAFCKVLDNPENLKYISTIMVEGHADRNGTIEYNFELTYNRAWEVLRFILSDPQMREKPYRSVFGLGAFSEFRPRNLGDSPEDYSQNRRIEIRIQMTDQERNWRLLPASEK